jgi:hypothetical protein
VKFFGADSEAGEDFAAHHAGVDDDRLETGIFKKAALKAAQIEMKRVQPHGDPSQPAGVGAAQLEPA